MKKSHKIVALVAGLALAAPMFAASGDICNYPHHVRFETTDGTALRVDLVDQSGDLQASTDDNETLDINGPTGLLNCSENKTGWVGVHVRKNALALKVCTLTLKDSTQVTQPSVDNKDGDCGDISIRASGHDIYVVVPGLS